MTPNLLLKIGCPICGHTNLHGKNPFMTFYTDDNALIIGARFCSQEDCNCKYYCLSELACVGTKWTS